MLCAPGVALTVFDERFTIAPGDGPPDEFNTTPDIVAARATALIWKSALASAPAPSVIGSASANAVVPG
jgi:hypothetical protein